MKKHEPLSSAKAIAALLILALAAVVFYKFISSQNQFLDDPMALRNYAIYAIVGGGFLVGLLYLVGQTTHTPKKVASKSRSTKRRKK